MIPGSEMRLHSRIECLGRATILTTQDAPRCPAKILDLSFGGCLMEPRNPNNLALEMMVELTFSLNYEPFRIRGEVRSLRPGAVGFQFHSLSPRTTRRLRELIADLGGEGRIIETYEVRSP